MVGDGRSTPGGSDPTAVAARSMEIDKNLDDLELPDLEEVPLAHAALVVYSCVQLCTAVCSRCNVVSGRFFNLFLIGQPCQVPYAAHHAPVMFTEAEVDQLVDVTGISRDDAQACLRRNGAPLFMGLASRRLDIGIFCVRLYTCSVLLLNAVWG
jgi:hypothetical protein